MKKILSLAVVRWVAPAACLLTLLGYWGAWVDHPAAGLVITGLDLGEYVKFLPGVRSGGLQLWRQGFYWPLLAVSLSLGLVAYRAAFAYSSPLRTLLIGLALVAALNLLPPAWSPPLLRLPEFRQQMAALLACLGVAALAPLAALLPARLAAVLIFVATCAAAWWPLRGFLTVLPEIAALYRRSLSPGWGVYVMYLGLLGLLWTAAALLPKRNA